MQNLRLFATHRRHTSSHRSRRTEKTQLSFAIFVEDQLRTGQQSACQDTYKVLPSSNVQSGSPRPCGHDRCGNEAGLDAARGGAEFFVGLDGELRVPFLRPRDAHHDKGKADPDCENDGPTCARPQDLRAGCRGPGRHCALFAGDRKCNDGGEAAMALSKG